MTAVEIEEGPGQLLDVNVVREQGKAVEASHTNFFPRLVWRCTSELRVPGHL